MKNYSLIILLLLSVVFIGCSRDNEPDPKALIQGSWKPVKEINKTIVAGNTTTQTKVSNTCEQQSRITFKADNSGTFIEYGDNGTANCNITDSGNFTYNYQPEIKKLSLTQSGETTDLNVTNISSTEMVYTLTETSSTNGVTTTFISEMYYSKVN